MPNFIIKGGVLTQYTGKGEKVVTIPNDPSNKVTEIGDSAFYKCSSLTKIVIPNSVTTIGYYVLAGCNNLKNVKAPAGFIDTLPERLKKQVTFTVYNEKKQKYTILNSCCIE